MNICGHAGASPEASKASPTDDSRRLGGRRRSWPTGGSAYGIPLKLSMPSSEAPTTVPAPPGSVTETGSAARFSCFSPAGRATDGAAERARPQMDQDNFISREREKV